MKVKANYILSLLLLIGISLNIYYLSSIPKNNDKDKMNGNINIGDGNAINFQKDNIEDPKEDFVETELENSGPTNSNNNPIDIFFDTLEFDDSSTLSLRLYAAFYKEC